MLEKLIGTWELCSWTYREDGGKETDYIGDNPGGILMFDRSGWMNVQVHAADRKNFASEGIMGGKAEEIREAFTTYFAYYGTYEVGIEDSTIVHRVEGALFPNWIGDKQVRKVLFRDDHLFLTTPPLQAAGRERMFTLKWRRVS
ncbi:MAG: lipocalin-like domain-containing protein [Cyclobacteriaceae bacterium]